MRFGARKVGGAVRSCGAGSVGSVFFKLGNKFPSLVYPFFHVYFILK